MSRLLDWLRMLFISVEFVGGLAVLAGYLHFTDLFSEIGAILRSDKVLWLPLCGIPTGLTGWAIRECGKLRSPLDKEENRVLYGWPGYPKLRDRAVFSLSLSVLCTVGAVGVWLAGKKLDDGKLAGLYIAFVVISGITVLSLVLANQRIKEIVLSVGAESPNRRGSTRA